MVKCHPFYFKETGCDLLLGDNFLQLFQKVTFNDKNETIHLHTLCNHWINIKRLKLAFKRKIPIPLKRSKRGDMSFVSKPRTDTQEFGKPLLKFEANLKMAQQTLDEACQKIRRCYSENPLAFWDKNKIFAHLELKDKEKIIRVTPMRYNEIDAEEFRKQLKGLEALKLIEQSNSPLVPQLLWFVIMLKSKEEKLAWLQTIKS